MGGHYIRILCIKPTILVFVICFSLSTFASNTQACRVFRFHAGLELPSHESLIRASREARAQYGTDFKTRLTHLSLQPAELQQILSNLSKPGSYSWTLHFDEKFWNCAEPYLRLDTDQDGLADWTIAFEQELSTTLIPYDPDIDNDGIKNMFDPSPSKVSSKILRGSTGLPLHLLDKDIKLQSLQEELYKRYDILVVNHSDEHSLGVLSNLKFLLENGFPDGFLSRMNEFKILYAFSGHNQFNNFAAYHRQMKAISIGGRLSYGEELSTEQRVDLLHTLAHEIGHASLFGLVSPQELRGLAESQVRVSKILAPHTILSFLDNFFFRPLVEKTDIGHSRYSQTNLHEWFAETFSAIVLQRMRAKGAFAPSDSKFLPILDVSKETSHWFGEKFGFNDHLGF